MNRIQTITAADQLAYKAAGERWNSIAKPLGSFGLLEHAVQKLAAIQGTPDVCMNKRAAVIFCGDHGVVAEGVTQCGSDVTAKCADAIAEGKSNINALADTYRAEVFAVDVGTAFPCCSKNIIRMHIADGTQDITKGPAMTREQAIAAVRAGMDTAERMQKNGMQILIAGEMGIGNTTAAAAIASVLLGLPSEQVTGKGAGLSAEGLRRKISAVKRAIAVNQPDPDDPLAVLQTVGGFEIAAMTGLFLGGAIYQIPVIIDGVISAASAALAYKWNPVCAQYLFASHCSGEPAAKGLLDLIGLRAVIDAELRLGEGTGGILLLPLLDGALALYRNAHRFSDANIERYVPLT